MTVLKHIDTLAYSHNEAHVMLDKKNGKVEFLANPANHLHELLRFLRIHACCRLVQKQKLRLCRKGTGNLQAALCTVGQVFRGLVCLVLEVENLQKLKAVSFNLPFLLSVASHTENSLQKAVFYMVMKGNFYVVQHRKLGKEADVLERAGYAALRNLIRRKSHDGLSVKFNFAAGGLINPCKEVECRGFTGAVRPDKSDKLALLKIYIEVRYSLEAAEHFNNMGCFQKRFHYSRPPFVRSRNLKGLNAVSSTYPKSPCGR